MFKCSFTATLLALSIVGSLACEEEPKNAWVDTLPSMPPAPSASTTTAMPTPSASDTMAALSPASSASTTTITPRIGTETPYPNKTYPGDELRVCGERLEACVRQLSWTKASASEHPQPSLK